MGVNIPGLCNLPNVVPELTNVLLRGETDIRGTMKINETLLTATPADINLSGGMVAGAIVTGIVVFFNAEIVCVNGTAVVVPLITIPIGSLIIEVMTCCTEAFNGDTTKTFEIGIAGNTDKYVDPVDCPVTLNGVMDLLAGTNNDQKLPEPIPTAMALQAVYTNTANATTGKMKIKIVYC